MKERMAENEELSAWLKRIQVNSDEDLEYKENIATLEQTINMMEQM
jgi:hypothetical protein